MQRLNLDEELLAELMALLAKGYNLLFTKKTPSLQIVKDDPDDDKFIECALALDAEYIISGDKDLLAVKEYKDIRIITPAEFLILLQ